MKRSIIIGTLSLIAALALIGDAPAAPRGVIEYYRMIPEDALTGSRYQLRQDAGKWKCASTTGQELLPVVDVPNGYLRIDDPGTGGGTLIQEVALFLDEKKKPFIGLNVTQFDGVGEAGTLQFFMEDKGALVDCTAKIMPAMGLRHFFAESFHQKLKSVERLGSLCQIVFSLPRQGTTIKAMLRSSRLEMNLANASPGSADKKLLEEMKKSIRYTQIELPWNRARGLFTIGAKKNP